MNCPKIGNFEAQMGVTFEKEECLMHCLQYTIVALCWKKITGLFTFLYDGKTHLACNYTLKLTIYRFCIIQILFWVIS